MRSAIREVRYASPQYMRVQLFPVFEKKKSSGTRRKRYAPTTEVQQNLNAKNASRRLSDLIHLNFTPADLAVHPTYKDGFLPASVDEANRNMRNYIRRLKTLYKKINGTLDGFKYIFVTEQRKSRRIHHHLVLSANGLSTADVINCWGMGRCNPRNLEFDEDGVVGLSHYLVKDPVTNRRWYASAGLARPNPKTSDSRWSQRDMSRAMSENADVTTLAQKYYPGYTIRSIEYQSTFGGDFCEIFLYRTKNDYFEYDRYGRIKYKGY